MAIKPSEVRAQFPADPDEYNGVDLTKMKPMHKVINRELLASGMDYTKIALKYDYAKSSLYRMARMPHSRAYRDFLMQAGRDQSIATAHEVMETLTDILREDAYDEHVTPGGSIVIKKVDNKDRLKSAELLGKAYGIYVDKQVNKTEMEIVVDIEGADEDGDVIDV